MWNKGKWDHPCQLEGYRSAPSYQNAYQNALPGIVGGISSPWTLPLPDPFSLSPVGDFSGLGGLGASATLSGGLGASATLSGADADSAWESAVGGEWNEPRYVQPYQMPRGQPLRSGVVENVFGTFPHQIPTRRAPQPTAPVGSSMDTSEPRSLGSAGLGSSLKSLSPVLRDDPGLSGQRLKRVLHVKQAPIYKYSLWISHWIEQGGRTSGDPMTPRSELTKSEFDIQYGAWRKALVEGPPRKA